MKQTITIKDLDLIAGKFILQLNSEEPIKLTDHKLDLEFYLVKRVNFIAYGDKGVISSDLFGNTHSHSKEDFVEMFNNYLGESKGTRYHRLLYAKELDVLFDWMKKRNY